MFIKPRTSFWGSMKGTNWWRMKCTKLDDWTIERFEYEYCKICVISAKLQTLIISNGKIVPNCCFPAFFHEVLVNYVSNMIRIRLNNCTIFCKQGFYRSSHRRCSVKKGVLRKIFSKFTGKHLCHWPYFNKVAGLRL